MGTLDELDAVDTEYPVESDTASEADILAEGTVSSKLLASLKKLSQENGLDYRFERGKGGTEHYTFGDQTATLRQHVSAGNKATLILSQNDLEMDWWKKITDQMLHPGDVIIE